MRRRLDVGFCQGGAVAKKFEPEYSFEPKVADKATAKIKAANKLKDETSTHVHTPQLLVQMLLVS